MDIAKKPTRGVGRKAPVRAAAGSRGRASTGVCLIPSCGEPKKGGAKFCLQHNSFVDVMRYQAKTQGKDQLAKLNTVLADDIRAIDEVESYAAKVALTPDCRRKPLINWVEFNERYIQSLSKGSYTTMPPYERMEWILEQVRRFGRDQEEMKQEWRAHEANELVRRDWNGYKGQVRLWLQSAEYEKKGVTQMIEGSTTQGGDRRKNPKEATVDALKMHCHDMFGGSHGIGFNAAFFRGESSSSKAAGQDVQEEADEGDNDGAQVDLRSEATPGCKRSIEDSDLRIVDLEESDDEKGPADISMKKKRKVSVVDAAFFTTVVDRLTTHTAVLKERIDQGDLLLKQDIKASRQATMRRVARATQAWT